MTAITIISPYDFSVQPTKMYCMYRFIAWGSMSHATIKLSWLKVFVWL